MGSGQSKCSRAWSRPRRNASKFASSSFGLCPYVSVISASITAGSTSSSADSAPRYAMLRSSVRARAPSKRSLQSRANGIPRSRTSSRRASRRSGQLASCSTQPPGTTSATSRIWVAGFSATMRSGVSARAVHPAPFTRISYQVGSPWMLDGNRFLPDTGMPIRKMACISSPLALADPVPFTVAIFSAKSLIRSGMAARNPGASGGGPGRVRGHLRSH